MSYSPNCLKCRYARPGEPDHDHLETPDPCPTCGGGMTQTFKVDYCISCGTITRDERT